MTALDRFEIKNPIYRSGVGVLYQAESSDQPGHAFVCKVIEPGILLDEPTKVDHQNQLFVNRAKDQQKIAESPSPFWAPIYAYGITDDQKAFYCTDLFDRSAQQFIDTRIQLLPEVFHAIVQSIAKGLGELKSLLNRPHGNLKPANVLISGDAASPVARVVLTDPLSDDELTRFSAENDLRRMGEIIYQLVMHRPPSSAAGWKAEFSKEWNVFGKQTRGWFDLCNRLLNAATDAEPITLDEAVQTIVNLKPEPKKTASKLIAASVIFIVMGALGYYLLHTFYIQGDPPTPNEWQTYSQEVYRAWGYNFCRNIKDLPWLSEKEFEVIEDNYKKINYASDILKKVDKRQYLEKPNFEGWEQLRPSASGRQVRNAMESAQKVSAFLDSQNEAAWAPIKAMQANIDRWGSNTWLMGLLDQVHPGPYKENIIESIQTVRVIYPQVLKLETMNQSITGHLQTLKDLLGQVQEPEQKLTAFLAIEFTPLTQAQFAAIENTVFYNYARQIDGLLEKANIALKTDPENKGKLSEYLAGLLNGLDTLEAPDKIILYFNDYDKKISELIITWDKLENVEFAKALSTLKIPQIRSLWQDWAQAVKSLPAGQKTKPLLRDLWKRFAEIQGQLLEYEAFLNESSIRTPWVADQWPREYYQQIYQQLYSKELDVITQQMQQKHQVYAEEFAQALQHRRQESAVYFEKVRNMFTDLIRVENAVNLYYSLDDTLPETQMSLDQIYISLTTNEIWPDMISNPSLTAFDRTVSELRRISTLTSPNELLEILRTSEAHPVYAYAAWQKLGPPDTIEQKDLQIQAVQQLSQIFGSLNDKNRGEELRKTTETQLRHRIISFYQQESSEFAERISDNIRDITAEIDLPVFVAMTNSRLNASLQAVNKVSITDAETLSSMDRELSAAFELITVFHQITERMVRFVQAPEWKSDDYNHRLFKIEVLDPIESQQQWPMEDLAWYDSLKTNYTTHYKIISEYIPTFAALENRITEMNKQMEEEDQSDPETRTNLRTSRSNIDQASAELAEWKNKNVIRYQAEISQRIVSPDGLSKTLDDTEDLLTPKWCRLFKLTSDPEKGKIVTFKDTMWQDFIPVRFQQGNENMIYKNCQWTFLSPEDWRNLKDRSAITTGGSSLQSGFFVQFTPDTPSLPQYIAAKKDPTVILRYVPGNNNDIKPFYMAIRETTFTQYNTFLQRKLNNLWDDTQVLNWVENYLNYRNHIKDTYQKNGINFEYTLKFWMGYNPFRHPFDKFTPGKNETLTTSQNQLAEEPVVLVTFEGARAYADWLSDSLVSLPDVSQHEHLGKKILSGDLVQQINLSEDNYLYYGWNQFNNRTESRSSYKIYPYGIIRPVAFEQITSAGIKGSRSIFPKTTIESVSQDGFYDLQGNVWEWCAQNDQPAVCGYSTLTPEAFTGNLEYYTLTSTGTAGIYEYIVESATDVGFRLIINIP